MSILRKQDSYQKLVYDFIADTYVICPSCHNKAIVKIPESDYYHKKNDHEIKLVCTHCGHSKRLQEIPKEILTGTINNVITGRFIIVGGAIDPYFHLPLWLTINCCDNILWAYNYKHLSFLESHVEAKLRERSILEMRNKSLGSRLPKWMTSKKNRDTVLKTIAQLKLR